MQRNYAFAPLADVAPMPFQQVTYIYPEAKVKVRVCHAFELEPRYQTKLDNLFVSLKKDAKQYILDNPFKVGSLREFRAILEDELAEITEYAREKKNSKAMLESYDMLVKHCALHILTEELSNR